MRETVSSAAVRRALLRALVITLLVLGIAIGHALSTAGHSHAEATSAEPGPSTSQVILAAAHDNGAPAGTEAVALTCLAVLLAAAVAVHRRSAAAATAVDLPRRSTPAQPRAPTVPRHPQRTSTVLQI